MIMIDYIYVYKKTHNYLLENIYYNNLTPLLKKVVSYVNT